MRSPLCAPGLRLAQLTCLSGLALGASLATAAPTTVQEIDDCVEANLPRASTQIDFEFRKVDRGGSETEMVGELFWKDFDGKARALLKLSAPPKYRGAAVLFIEKDDDKRDIFMYLPELGRTKRISGRMMAGSLFGTDFSYEEFERLQGFAEDLSTERLDDADLDGTKVYVLERRPGSDSSYQRTVQYIEQSHCVVLKIEFYGKGDKLHKQLLADPDSIQPVGNDWIAHRLTMQDLLDRTETTMTLENVRFDQKISRKLFSASELEKGR